MSKQKATIVFEMIITRRDKKGAKYSIHKFSVKIFALHEHDLMIVHLSTTTSKCFNVGGYPRTRERDITLHAGG